MYSLKLDFTLDNNIVPNNINLVMASWMKMSIQEYDEKAYNQLYKSQKKQIRTYTFCLKMRSLEFKNGFIYLANNNVSLVITDYNFDELILFYNSFLRQLKKKEDNSYSMKKNSMILRNISMKPLKEINDNNVIIKMESPLIVRRALNNNDTYLGIYDEHFKDELEHSVINLLKNLRISGNNVDISLIKGKKTVMSLFRHKATATLGYFTINADPKIINILMQTGIGDRRSAGAGKFRIVG